MTVKCYYAIFCGGLQGLKKYQTYEEAAEAAVVRTRLTRRDWIVKAIVYYT